MNWVIEVEICYTVCVYNIEYSNFLMDVTVVTNEQNIAIMPQI